MPPRPWAQWIPRGTWAADTGIALIVQAAVTMPFVVPRSAEMPAATWAAYGLTTLTVLPLVARRRAPVTVLLVVLAAGALYKFAVDGPGQPLPYTGLVAFCTVAELSSPARRLAVGLLVLTVVFPSVALNTGEARELLFSLFVFAAAYAFGRYIHTRKAYVRAMEDRALQLEVTHRIEGEQAAARERARIAREMHDILSHAVSLMIVQAEAGPVAVRTAPERAEAAFDAISETGRDAMVQLRRMLGVLRDGGPETEPSPRSPQPGLAGLPTVLERVRSGGLQVDFTLTGEPERVPDDTGTTVHRIVQEALTNVVKHARAREVTVELHCTSHDVTVIVRDDGQGPGTTTGLGLVGIRERAAAHGGEVRSGAGPDGCGYQVHVVIPHAASTQEVSS